MKKKHTCLKWLFSPFLILALTITLQFGRQNATLGAASAAVPTYPEKFVGYPEYNTSDGKGAAGMASVVKLKGGTQSYIVSVRHVLGPNGAFEKQAAAKD